MSTLSNNKNKSGLNESQESIEQPTEKIKMVGQQCNVNFSRMRPRDSNWIYESAKNLNEQRFAVNLDKMPRVSTLVKKGELVDSKGCKNALKNYDMSEIKSRNECKIIGGNNNQSTS